MCLESIIINVAFNNQTYKISGGVYTFIAVIVAFVFAFRTKSIFHMIAALCCPTLYIFYSIFNMIFGKNNKLCTTSPYTF